MPKIKFWAEILAPYEHVSMCTSGEGESISHVPKAPYRWGVRQNILQTFRESEAGSICATDELIQQVGYRHYCLRRCHKSNMIEVKKNVMQEMGELA